MVKIRLARFGKKGAPHYRIVAIQAREKRESKAIEYLGHYNPRTKPSTVKLDKERIQYWLSVGAQPTDTVAYLLSKEGLFKVDEKKTYSKKPGKKKTERAKLEKEKSKGGKKPEQKKEEATEDTKPEKSVGAGDPQPKKDEKPKPKEEKSEQKEVEDTQPKNEDKTKEQDNKS